MDDTCGEFFGGYSASVEERMTQIRCTKDADGHRDHEYEPLGLRWHVGVGGALYITTPVPKSASYGTSPLA